MNELVQRGRARCRRGQWQAARGGCYGHPWSLKIQFIIEAEKRLRMDPKKVEAILSWEAPTSVKGVRSFLGFANFYRRFIKNFAEVAAPLTRLTGNMSFRWTQEEQDAFDKLKKIFISEPVLAHFDPDRETVVETDSSGLWWIDGHVHSFAMRDHDVHLIT